MRTRASGFLLFADAASACVCKSGTCDWDDLVPENAAAGDTCDIEPVNGVINANILCEDSDTNANGVQPTAFRLQSRTFTTFAGNIILYKCSTLTEFYMTDGSSYSITGKIEVTQNDALTRVEFNNLESVTGSFDLSSNAIIESLALGNLQKVSLFMKINDNGGSGGGISDWRTWNLGQVGANGPETFYFDTNSDTYVTSNNNAWSLSNTSFAYSSGVPSVALEMSGNTFGSSWTEINFNALSNVRGDLKIQNNYFLDRIGLASLLAVWGEMLIGGNSRSDSEEWSSLWSFCKYSDNIFGDTAGVKSVLLDAYVPTLTYYLETNMIRYVDFVWTPINQVVASFQNSSQVDATQASSCYYGNVFETTCASHAGCGYSNLMEQETFCGSSYDWNSNSYGYECKPCVECVIQNQDGFSQVTDVSSPGMDFYPIDGSCPGKCVYVPPSPPPAESPPPYDSITNDNFRSAISACLQVDAVNGNCELSGYGPMSEWDVSAVTDMSYAFNLENSFTADLKDWDTSSVTNMEGMFYYASAFTGLLYTWDVSKVRNMKSMFEGASAFNSRLKDWDVSSVTDMSSMFSSASSFNQDLRGWSTGNVLYMNHTFNRAISFGTYFETYRFDADPNVMWDTANVLDTSYMFNDATSLTSVPHYWNVSSVTSMQRMFSGADSFRPEAFAEWDTSSVLDFSYIFAMADPYSSPYWGLEGSWAGQERIYNVHSWDVSSATTLEGMFYNNPVMNDYVSSSEFASWTVSNVQNMDYVFYGCSKFVGTTSGIDAWDTSQVTSMRNMFGDAVSFEGNLKSWDVSKVTDMDSMFRNATTYNEISWPGTSLP